MPGFEGYRILMGAAGIVISLKPLSGKPHKICLMITYIMIYGLVESNTTV